MSGGPKPPYQLGLVEQKDSRHFRLLVHHSEQGIETILDLHSVDVIELLHDQLDALVSAATHDGEARKTGSH